MKKIVLFVFLSLSLLCFGEWEYVEKNNSVRLVQENTMITLADGGGGVKTPIFHYTLEELLDSKKPMDTYGIEIIVDDNPVIKADAMVMYRVMRFPVKGMTTDEKVFNELLPQMKNGKMMKIKFLAKKYSDILIEIPLDSFNESYQQMK